VGEFILSKERIKAFWSKVNKQGPYPDQKKYPKLKTRCWEFIGCLDRDGYGLCNVNDKTQRVNKVAYELQFGPVPKGKIVCHNCDNRKCVRHLYAGTHTTNARDRTRRNRNRYQLGEACTTSKITDAQAIRIRKLYSTGAYTQLAIANYFRVNRATISYIIGRKTFAHV
jgi:hypothetical protein